MIIKLLSLIYKELMQMDKRQNTQFTKEQIETASKHKNIQPC